MARVGAGVCLKARLSGLPWSTEGISLRLLPETSLADDALLFRPMGSIRIRS